MNAMQALFEMYNERYFAETLSYSTVKLVAGLGSLNFRTKFGFRYKML